MTRCKVIDYDKGIRMGKGKGNVRERALNLLRGID